MTARGLPGGRRVGVAVSEFGFLGGSIGVAAAERLTLAVERATAERLPLIAAPASGGTRMQEGTVAFLGNLPGFLAGSSHAIHVTRVSSLYASRPR
jgi:acetyl-CoA carboxylase beta subunit